eukprot:2488778-Karenia_brevis.AAC.1
MYPKCSKYQQDWLLTYVGTCSMYPECSKYQQELLLTVVVTCSDVFPVLQISARLAFQSGGDMHRCTPSVANISKNGLDLCCDMVVAPEV